MMTKIEEIMDRIVPRFKLWLEYEGAPILGEGRAAFLEAIDEVNSMSKACESLKISYRYGWGCVRKIERRLESPVVKRFRGGYGRGGAALTDLGKMLLKRYRDTEERIKGELQVERKNELMKDKLRKSEDRLSGERGL